MDIRSSPQPPTGNPGRHYDPTARRLTWALPRLEPGVVLVGQATAQLAGLRAGAALAVLTELRLADGTLVAQATATVQAAAPAPAVPQIGPAGGVVTLADWTDSQVNWPQRQTGANWGVAGMGSGNDYAATPDGTASLTSTGSAWVDVNVKAMVQAWVANPTQNQGLVLTQDAASGYVYYTFCSELGWSPCGATQAPKLTIWYH